MLCPTTLVINLTRIATPFHLADIWNLQYKNLLHHGRSLPLHRIPPHRIEMTAEQTLRRYSHTSSPPPLSFFVQLFGDQSAEDK